MIPANINSLLLSAEAGAAPTAYQISRSLRFNSADSAYLNRTPTSAGNRKTWTFSCWTKRSILNQNQIIFSAGPRSSSGNATGLVDLQWEGDILVLLLWTSNVANVQLKTTQVFRDPSAWYHIVAVLDTDNATSTDRSRLYVNGSRITTFSSASYPSLGAQFSVNNTEIHEIGRYVWSQDQYLASYLADIHFIDGQALTPSSFAETNATTGQWVAKAYSGTYGTNGFRLDFADNSDDTATTLGKDTSGNNNNWTPNNLAAASNYVNVAGVGTDPNNMFDSDVNSYCTGPTNTALTWNGTINLGTGKYYLILSVWGLSTQGPSSASLVVGGTTYTSTYTEMRANTDFHNQVIGKAGTFTTTANGRRTNLTTSSSGSLTQITATATTGGFSNRFFAVVFVPSGVADNDFANHVVINNAVDTDSFVDSPSSYGTDTGIGGEIRGNYATLNPLSTVTTVTLANGNLQHSSVTAGQNAIATIGVSTGKWYWEVVATAGTTQTRVGVYSTAASSLYSLAANNTVYGIRFDADAGTLDWTTDGSSWTSIATGLTSGPYFPYFNNNGSAAKTVTVNFGQRPFAYTAPSGYKALCDTNLTAPTIAKPSTVMDVTTYTGNGSTQTISGLGFSPDFVWIKGRSGATDHALYDALRGVQLDLASNNTAAETTQSQGLTAFNSDGFSLGTLAKVNTSAATYAGWCWDAGSSNTTNTAGSITSTVRTNTSAGFSIVTYTGNGVANSTIGHGLGVAPSLIVIKRRDSAGANGIVFTTAVDGSNDIFILNATDAKANAAEVSPTSTVFTVGGGAGQNANNGTYVAYCWASITGYSAFGSYTGNGNASGPFVYLGFRPALVIVKMSSSTGNWTILDYKREGYNVDNDPLFPNLANAEGTTDLIDITSNGFKVRTTDATFNTNAGTYVYAAWAEFPFQYARAR